MLDWILSLCIVGFCGSLTVPLVRFLWFMVNRDPDDPRIAQWEREHRAMSKQDRKHVRKAIAHGQADVEPCLAEAAAKEAQVVPNFYQQCLAATHFQQWSAIAGLFATGATVARALNHPGSGVEGSIWIGLIVLLLAGRWTTRLLRSIRANRRP